MTRLNARNRTYLRQQQIGLRLEVVAGDERILAEVGLGESTGLRETDGGETALCATALRETLR